MKSMQERVKPSPIRYNDEESQKRLREMILYISGRCESDPKFGATKLNKILSFADFISYANYHKPITGAQYQRLPNGPAPVYLVPLREKMLADGEIVIRKERFLNYIQHRIIPLREPNLDMFTGRDIALVEDIIEAVSDDTATSISDRSHGIAWKIAENQEIIPYETILLDNKGLTENDVEEAHALIREHGWQGV